MVLLADDMGWAQAGFNGGKEVPTPNIDRLARQGVRLTQFYVQPACTASRGALLTGRYAWKTGTEVRPTATSRYGMLADERTLAEALREAGYRTWMVGKWHLGQWQPYHLPRARGFEHYYGHYSALIDSFTHTRGGVLDWHRNGKPVVEKGYSTFLLAKEAVQLITAHDGKSPFSLFVSFNAVHSPHQAPASYRKKYAYLGRAGPQRAQLECMDVAIGRILKALKKKGIANDTLVLFTNDNGGTPATGNGPYRGYKEDYHEGGIRVPAVVRWPGRIPAGSATDLMLHIVDVFPTFIRLAGATPENGLELDGKDIWKSMARGRSSPRKKIVHSLQVIRRGDWKLIEEGARYYGNPKQPLQLYNIRKDPYEKQNVAQKHPDVVQRLRDRLKFHRQFARQGEPREPIPDFPPVVYGALENAEYGDAVREKLADLDVESRDKTIRR